MFVLIMMITYDPAFSSPDNNFHHVATINIFHLEGIPQYRRCSIQVDRNPQLHVCEFFILYQLVKSLMPVTVFNRQALREGDYS